MQGNWFGEQIVPQQWVINSIAAKEDHLKPGPDQAVAGQIGYGYQWWLPAGQQGDFLARGVYGQYIYVNPREQVVIVKTSADPLWRAGAKDNLAMIRMFQEIATQLK